MFNIYFENRLISISSPEEADKAGDLFYCKGKKSFDKVYNKFISDTNILTLHVAALHPKRMFKYLRSKYIHVKAAGGVVFKNNNVLVIKRNGLWDLPKGKIEKNESKKHAAVREVEEECGISNPVIKNKLSRTFHTYQINHKNIFKTTYWYMMEYNGNETLVPQTKEGITEVEWIEKDKIRDIMKHSYKSLHPLFKIILKQKD